MAKYEARLTGKFSQIEERIKTGILHGSATASLEESGSYRIGDVRCSVMAFERYSYMGNNRVGLTVTLFGNDGNVRLCAVSTGGSQAMFFKINTFGEQAFLDKLTDIVEELK